MDRVRGDERIFFFFSFRCVFDLVTFDKKSLDLLMFDHAIQFLSFYCIIHFEKIEGIGELINFDCKNFWI